MTYANLRHEAEDDRSLAEDRRNFAKHCTSLAKRRLGTIRRGDIEKLHRSIGEKNGLLRCQSRAVSLKSDVLPRD